MVTAARRQVANANLIGQYRVAFTIWLKDHPNVTLYDSSQEFTVTVIDPCAPDYAGKRPGVCNMKMIENDAMPTWFS